MGDLGLCISLSIAEALLVATPKHSLIQISLILLLTHYSLLKFYRVFIYPFYFSPLRNVPGPKACPPDAA